MFIGRATEDLGGREREEGRGCRVCVWGRGGGGSSSIIEKDDRTHVAVIVC